MLILKEIKDISKYELNVDYYIPISIKFNNSNNIFYWRTGNFKNSLLEIGIDSKTGELISITLVSINNVELINEPFHIQTALINGIPSFKCTFNMNNKLYDIKEEIYVFLNKRYIFLQIGKMKDVKKSVCLGNIYLMFNNKDILCSFLINNLSNDEYQVLKNNFNL